jgi:hypothetical protein
MISRIKFFEVTEPIDIDGITLKGGHYMGIATWSSSLVEGNTTEEPCSYHLHLKRADYEAMCGLMPNDKRWYEIDVTQLMNDGRMR